VRDLTGGRMTTAQMMEHAGIVSGGHAAGSGSGADASRSPGERPQMRSKDGNG
jgi:hypothetical protein